MVEIINGVKNLKHVGKGLQSTPIYIIIPKCVCVCARFN